MRKSSKSKSIMYYLNNGSTQMKYFNLLNNLQNETLDNNAFADEMIKLTEEMEGVDLTQKVHFTSSINHSRHNRNMLLATLTAFSTGISMK